MFAFTCDSLPAIDILYMSAQSQGLTNTGRAIKNKRNLLLGETESQRGELVHPSLHSYLVGELKLEEAVKSLTNIQCCASRDHHFASSGN